MTTNGYSSITAVLPTASAGNVMDEIKMHHGASALAWRARGTLLNDQWWKHWVPPISPAKTLLQLVVPDQDVQDIADAIALKGRLHQQATGAVFSTPCHDIYFGPDYHHWPTSLSMQSGAQSISMGHGQSIIQCIVSQNRSNKVCRAAINAGAHGPIVHYCEGQGLRDRLGWLRITKEHDQEMLIVLVDSDQAESVFAAMTEAGEFHRPGRGLIYRVDGVSGLSNLPSRASSRRYAADMQQIIRAIDHLSGHSHWRDQSGATEEKRRANKTRVADSILRDQIRVSAMVRRAESQRFTDLMLDAGVPGLTEVEAFFVAADEGCQVAGARVNDEYRLYRSILSAPMAKRIRQVVEETASDKGVRDLCVFSNPIAEVVRYVPGKKDHRAAESPILAATPEVLSESA
ncbi:MAG: hypothetical protein AAF465_11665 [Pseudomonadota bacterium]